MTRIAVCLTTAAALFTGAAPLVGAADPPAEWPQFLGPKRNGISAETGLIDRIPESGVPEIWRAKGGVGMSGLAIAGGRLVTMAHRGGKQAALVLDASTGKTLASVEIAPEYTNSMGDGPRATPAISDDVAYVFTGEGILAAVDLKSGEKLWSHDVVEELGGRVAEYGMAASPLVVGKLVVVTAGASKGTVAAYDKTTGKPAWQAIANNGRDTAGYSSPTLLTLGGREQIVVIDGKAAIGISPTDGKLLWRYPYDTNFDCNIAVPIVSQGRLFLSAGENHGCVMLDPVASGTAFTLKEVWSSQGVQSVMRNEWQTSLLIDGHLYGMDNVGGAGPVTHLNCVDAATGERQWQEKRFGKGNLIAADGKLFISTMKGELVLVRATPEKFEELGRTTVLDSTRQAPALVDGRLYLRDDREIVCLDVRRKK